MSKVTVVTGADGAIAAIANGHLSRETSTRHGSSQGGIFALPGQKLHEIVLKEDVSQLTSFADLRERLLPHLVTKG